MELLPPGTARWAGRTMAGPPGLLRRRAWLKPATVGSVERHLGEGQDKSRNSRWQPAHRGPVPLECNRDAMPSGGREAPEEGCRAIEGVVEDRLEGVTEPGIGDE